jgi:SAM-dependent methyltransferase
MLDRAVQRSAGLPIRYRQADCRSLELEERFACALMTGHAFQFMLTEDDQRALLARVRHHLKPGGVFAFESRNPRPELLTEATEPEFWRSYRTDDGRWFDLLETRTCDPDQPIVHYRLHRRARDTGEDISSRTVLRFPKDEEIRRRLRETGFALEALYGDWDRTSMTPASPELIYVCRKG